MLRRFMPKSLMWRSLLIIGTPLILVQIISIWVFYDRHVDTITRRMASSLAGEIRLTVNHLQQYPSDADLVWMLSEVQTNLNIRATYRPGQQLQTTEHRGIDTRIGDQMHSILSGNLHRAFVIDTESDPDNIMITIQLEGGVLEIVTTKKKLSTITTELFVMWSVGSSLVFLLIAALFMRNQVRPIRRLAVAADSFGKGRDVPDFKPTGATEVRQASTAFIIMRERIKRQMQQRTEMLAGISHDLRTPITRMKLQLEMLNKDDPGVDALRQDIEDMEQMVEEYLAFARGEGFEQATETSLPVLLKDVVQSAQRNGHLIELHTRGTLRATVRPGAFKRCVTNLINNAAGYGDTVQIRAQRRGRFIEITVDDNGPGVPEAQRRDVFKPFYRGEGARTQTSGGGAGLGLTIARDIIRGHGGDIHLADSPLGGLRAVLRLPL